LQLDTTPQLFINLTVYPYTDGLSEARDVPGGTGIEYSTVHVVPFLTRSPILFPLAVC
jgi:hypothetical protein